MRALIFGSIEWNQPFGSIHRDMDGNYFKSVGNNLCGIFDMRRKLAQNQEPAIY